MHEAINYDVIAPVSAQTRAAAPHVVAVRQQWIAQLPAGATIVELGGSTGNHLFLHSTMT